MTQVLGGPVIQRFKNNEEQKYNEYQNDADSSSSSLSNYTPTEDIRGMFNKDNDKS